MSLSSHDFKAIYINRKSQETTNALADHKARLKDHNDIQSQVDAFLKSGGKIDYCIPSVNASTATYATDITLKDRAYIETSLSALKASFGNNMSIGVDRETGQYKAFYKDNQVGTTHKSASSAT